VCCSVLQYVAKGEVQVVRCRVCCIELQCIALSCAML